LDDNNVNLQLSECPQAGLYLFFKDGSKATFTREHIQKKAEEYWNDPQKISPQAKAAGKFQRCTFCPLRKEDDFCDAIRPVMPFLEIMDKYISFDRVVAVYREREGGLCHVADTTMQQALIYVSIISLMHYCPIGRRYWKYYRGVMPLEGGEESAIRIYLNMYRLHNGNKEEMNKVINTFVAQLKVTTRNQVERMALISKNDAFMNAFIKMHSGLTFLTMDMDIEKTVEAAFQEFEKSLLEVPKSNLQIER